MPQDALFGMLPVIFLHIGMTKCRIGLHRNTSL